MSFSSDTKKELSELTDATRHCKLAELTALCGACGQYIVLRGGRLFFMLQSENYYVIKAAGNLIHRLFHAAPEVSARTVRPGNIANPGAARTPDAARTPATAQNSAAPRQKVYILLVRDADLVKKMLFEIKLMKLNGTLVDLSLSDSDLIPENDCCKRAYLRGIFLCAGFVNDPHKAYRMEFVCEDEASAEEIKRLLQGFEIKAKTTLRKGRPVVYIKEGEKISSALGVIGAKLALMEFENIRILKDISGNVNRQVNCETANMNKAAVTAAAQIKQIQLIDLKTGLDNIPAELAEIARLRLENPDKGLKELGEMANPPVGKSGVYHRFKKIKHMAEELGLKE